MYREKLCENRAGGWEVAGKNLQALPWSLPAVFLSLAFFRSSAPTESLVTGDFKIGHYGTLGRLDAYTGGLGPWRYEVPKIFNLRSDNKSEDSEVMCETRLQKALLLKKNFLFYMKNTNQKNKGAN